MNVWARAIFAIVLGTVTVRTVSAQPGGYAPKGSYQLTCTNIAFDSSSQVLTAICHNSYGGPKGSGLPASLNVSACDPGADIENINSVLQCKARAGTWGVCGAVPSGSYQQSCQDWSVANEVLTAYCWDYTRGKLDLTSIKGWVRVTLPLSQCGMNGDIENIQGQLLCTQPAAASPSNGSGPSHPTKTANGSTSAGAPGTCKPGYVWRMANAADHVCVTAQTRRQTADDDAAAMSHTMPRVPGQQGQAARCVEGYVWRQAFPTDYVCVVPQTHAEALADNASSRSRTN